MHDQSEMQDLTAACIMHAAELWDDGDIADLDRLMCAASLAVGLFGGAPRLATEMVLWTARDLARERDDVT